MCRDVDAHAGQGVDLRVWSWVWNRSVDLGVDLGVDTDLDLGIVIAWQGHAAANTCIHKAIILWVI